MTFVSYTTQKCMLLFHSTQNYVCDFEFTQQLFRLVAVVNITFGVSCFIIICISSNGRTVNCLRLVEFI